MTKIISPTRILSLFIIISATIFEGLCVFPDELKCCNDKCSEPVSRGTTISKYPAKDEGMLSFMEHIKIEIHGKPINNKRTDLWFAKIKNNYGFVPKSFIREEKVVCKADHYVNVTIDSSFYIEKKIKLKSVSDNAQDSNIETNNSNDTNPILEQNIIGNEKIDDASNLNSNLLDSLKQTTPSNKVEFSEIKVTPPIENEISKGSKQFNGEYTNIEESHTFTSIPEIKSSSTIDIQETNNELPNEVESTIAIENSIIENVPSQQYNTLNEIPIGTNYSDLLNDTNENNHNKFMLNTNILDQYETNDGIENKDEQILLQTPMLNEEKKEEVTKVINEGKTLEPETTDKTIIEVLERSSEDDILNKTIVNNEGEGANTNMNDNKVQVTDENIMNYDVDSNIVNNNFNNENPDLINNELHNKDQNQQNLQSSQSSQPSISSYLGLVPNIQYLNKDEKRLQNVEEDPSNTINDDINQSESNTPSMNIMNFYEEKPKNIPSNGNSEIKDSISAFSTNDDSQHETKDEEIISATSSVTDFTESQKLLQEFVSIQEIEGEKEEERLDSSSVISEDVCIYPEDCQKEINSDFKISEEQQEEKTVHQEMQSILNIIKFGQWDTLIYVTLTAVTTLLFSLGYYYIENTRRDRELIAKINKLEKELLVSTKECLVLDETLKSTKTKLNSIEDESFGSNEMVASLKSSLEASENAKLELEEQISILEKDLENATEAGLELERMLREVLSSKDEVNPLAQSVEDLQARLNAQQAANESLTSALNLKTQENDSLAAELNSVKGKCKDLHTRLNKVLEDYKTELSARNNAEQELSAKVQQLELQSKEIAMEKIDLSKQLKNKEVEIKDLVEVIKQLNSNSLDLDKLYDVSHIKAEAAQLLEEKNDLEIRLSGVEGAHSLLEEHMKVIQEEMVTLSQQCKLAEKEKKEAETRLEVLSNYFKEKEAQRQKEEAMWLQKQGEVMSTVERIHTMQDEIHNYKQQIEILKREIIDQEREYKNQISTLETKVHEQWVAARQNERRLEESKVEASQLRNRLTLVEKNLNESDPDTKMHRMEANGEARSSPAMFLGAESSNSPIMFASSSGVPPPPPPHSFMYAPPFPPFLPPPLPSGSNYEVGQRPPPLGGRLASPPPMPMHASSAGRYDDGGSLPPPLSPHLLPSYDRHRSPPPMPYPGDHRPPSPGRVMPIPRHDTSWRDEALPRIRNFGFHPNHRDQRTRNHKGSLHSSGESLDKSHHSGKV